MNELRITCPDCGVFDGCSVNVETGAWKCHRGKCEGTGRMSPDEIEAHMSGRATNQRREKLVAKYDYVDADDDLLFQVFRYEPKTFRQRRPDGNGGWAWKLDGVQRVLYRLPRVLEAAASGQTVYVVEGEKDVEAIEHAGFVATCNPGGAGKWTDSYTASLQGARVVVIADRDHAGRTHALEVAEALDDGGIPVALREPPAPHKDVAELLEAGQALDDLEELQLAKPRRRAWVNLGDVDPERQEYLFFPYLPLGVTTTFAGDGGLGKSYASLAWAAQVSVGAGLGTGEQTEPGNVVLTSAEDSLEKVIVPRLDNLRADRSRITAFNFDLDEGLVFDSRGVAELDQVCGDVRPRLVVIDPITHFLGDQRDMHRANEVRTVLSNLNALAKRHDCAVLVLAHVNKNEGTKAAYRLLGSVEFRNAVRSLLVAGRLEDEPERGRAIFHDKANASETGEPIGFDLKRDPADLRGPGIFRWQRTDLTKAEVFEGQAPKVVKRQLANDILHALLKDGGAVSSERAKNVATAGGFISEATIRDARRELGVNIIKRPDGTEDWTLHHD